MKLFHVRQSRLNIAAARLAFAAAILTALALSGCAARGEFANREIGIPDSGIAAGDGGDDSANEHGVLHTIVFYIPNRLFDILDIARLRLHVGPGLAVGARATEVADVYLGSYASVYAGLPGPRMRPLPKLPFGVESFSGAEVSVVDATVTGGIGPDYSPSEFGANLHLLIVGLDFGLDPVEALDLLTGIFLIHLREDEM